MDISNNLLVEWSGVIQNTQSYRCFWVLPVSLTVQYYIVLGTHVTDGDDENHTLKWDYMASTLSQCVIKNDHPNTHMEQCILVFGL